MVAPVAVAAILILGILAAVSTTKQAFAQQLSVLALPLSKCSGLANNISTT
jgi:hypothetical protein